MVAIKGIFDGNNFFALEKVPVSTRSKVIITFIEETDEISQIRDLTSQTDSFKFWENEDEDIYQDYLKK